MASIKFSHKYDKLRVSGGFTTQVRLLDVLHIQLEELSGEFLEYDTDDGKFRLPAEGRYLMLILLKEDGNICTTLRPHTGGKYQHYHSLIGQYLPVEYR